MPRPLIVVFQLWESHHIFKDIIEHLIHALSEKGELHRARTALEARRYLSSTARPQAIFVADAAITSPEYHDIHLHLVEYAKDGGTVVYGGMFSSFVRPSDLDAMFMNVWGLAWRNSDYMREDFMVNIHAKGSLNCDLLVKQYSMKAVYLDGVALDEAVYLEVSLSKRMAKGKGAAKSPNTSNSTPVAFTKVGKGCVGYVGDVNAEIGTASLVLAMCFSPRSHSPTAPGKGDLSATSQNLSNSNDSEPKRAVSSPPRRNILILSLEKEEWIDEVYSTLFNALRQDANTTEVYSSFSALQALSFHVRPDAVLVSDAGITMSEYQDVLTRLIDYAQAGGTVVLGLQFSNHLPIGEARQFFSKWGVPWDAGSYHRTTFAVNPSGVPQPLSKLALLPSFSMKALHIKNAPLETAVYLPTPQSHTESHVFARQPIVGAKALESPAVFARVGEGFLGYVGDVNGEQGSNRILFEMCGVQIKPGDMGPRTFSTGLRLHPDGSTEPIMEVEPEIPLPGPAPSPRAPRIREAEVVARADRLAKIQNEKIKQADILKNEGNEMFRAEKWVEAAEKYRAAVSIAGPQPVYLSNLAAALLKAKLWVLAESAATRALLHDPKHSKSLYRRALARKEQKRFTAAEADLNQLLLFDRTNSSALSERMNIRTNLSDSRDWPGDQEELRRRGTRDDDAPLNIEDESDSEASHAGNGTPCKFYNHDGCRHGKGCRFKHASDSKSVRDELGRNVCIYWLLGECRFGTRCVYAHDGTYLPQRGWWMDTTRLARLQKEFKDAVTAAPRPLDSEGGESEGILAEAFRPRPWQKDLWAQAAYGEEVARMRQDEEDNDEDDYEDEDDHADDWGNYSQMGPGTQIQAMRGRRL